MKPTSLFHLTNKMILVSILAATCVIGIVHSSPTSTYQRRQLQDDRPGLLFINQIHGLEDADLFESGPGRSVGGTRTKRLGSLSIVNPLDVLRQRVLLELARRKMRQNQRQVDANRRFLETIGKRAVSNAAQFGIDSNEDPDPTDYASTQTNDYFYTFHVPGNDIDVKSRLGQQQHPTSDRGTERHLVWENHGADPVVQEVENDQARRMANELNLL